MYFSYLGPSYDGSPEPRELMVAILFFYVPAHAHKLYGASIERNSQRNINPSFMIMKM